MAVFFALDSFIGMSIGISICMFVSFISYMNAYHVCSEV